jgi:hypothetical protein
MELSPKEGSALRLARRLSRRRGRDSYYSWQASRDPLYHHAAYDIGAVYALESKSAEAVHWLREAADSGFHLYPRYQRDPLLSRIRQAPEFIQFLAEMKAQNESYQLEFGRSKRSRDRHRIPFRIESQADIQTKIDS